MTEEIYCIFLQERKDEGLKFDLWFGSKRKTRCYLHRPKNGTLY